MTYFHIYNQAHQKCVARNGERLYVARCDLNQCEQKWSWTRDGQQIMSALDQEKSECISVSKLVKYQKIIMYPCQSNTSFQRWECKNGNLLSIQGVQLYFNYGKHPVDIILHTRGGIWSRWVKYSTGRSLCDKGLSYIFGSQMLHIAAFVSVCHQARMQNKYPDALFVCTLQLRFFLLPFPIVSVAIWITVLSCFGHCLNFNPFQKTGAKLTCIQNCDNTNISSELTLTRLFLTLN